MKVCINHQGHMTKIVVMAINSKKPLRNLQNHKAYVFKLDKKQQAMEIYKICINHEPGMTLTYCVAR